MDFYVNIEPGLDQAHRRYLAAVDRFYMLANVLKRTDVLHPWLYDRCREVELEPYDHLDLWAREHYKSTIITYAGVIQEILNDPEVTIGIFSHTRGIAKAFIKQIRGEFESNELFRETYSDLCWSRVSQAPVWQEAAFTIRRRSNPKEATVEGWGLVDGQPTSKHFTRRYYDDVVTLESVSTPDQIKKTTDAWEMADNLGAQGGRVAYIGTRYAFGDTYAEIMDRGIVTPRRYPATDNGKADGDPVFMRPRCGRPSARPSARRSQRRCCRTRWATRKPGSCRSGSSPGSSGRRQ